MSQGRERSGVQHFDGKTVMDILKSDSLPGTGSARTEGMKPGQRFGAKACLIDMCFSGDDVEQAIRLRVSAVGCTEATPGCRSCAVARDLTEESRVHYSEEWDCEQAFVRHLQSEEFRRVLTAMDLCSSEPLVRIGDLSGRSGLDYLRELRGPLNVVEE